MAFGTAAAIGAGLAGSLGGAAMTSSSQRAQAEAAAQAASFQPYNLLFGGNNVQFSPTDGSALLLNPTLDNLQGLFNTSALQGMTPEGQAATGVDQLAGLQNFAASNMLGAQTGASSDYDTALANILGGSNNLQAAMLGLNTDAMNILNQTNAMAGMPGVGADTANFAINQGQGFLGADSQSVIDQTLQQLRDQARPYEERAVDSAVQDLYSRGVLGGTQTDRTMGELALSQETADIQRQLAAEQAGLTRFNANQQAGQGLLFGGLNGLLAGSDQQRQLASLFANTGLNAISGNTGRTQDIFNALSAAEGQRINRGQTRLSNLQGLFNFGQGGSANNLNQSIAALNSILGINTDMRSSIGLGGNIGGQQAAAGANVANAIMSQGDSAVGAGLLGLGNSVLNQGLDNLFNPPASPTTTGDTTGG
jgi:hypothetical protein